MQIRKYLETDLPEMTAIWNEVVEDGIAFPQEECLTAETSGVFFCFPKLYRRSGRKWQDCGLIYPASQQCRTLRTHLQRQLCGVICLPWTAYR